MFEWWSATISHSHCTLSSLFPVALKQQLEADEKCQGTITVKDQLGIHAAGKLKYLLK